MQINIVWRRRAVAYRAHFRHPVFQSGIFVQVTVELKTLYLELHKVHSLNTGHRKDVMCV